MRHASPHKQPRGGGAGTWGVTMANPYVFIVGCPRSGTTLLQRIVNAHSDIAIMPEAHWIRRLLDEREGLTPEDVVTPEVISYLLAQSQFVGLHLEQDKLDALLGDHQPVSLADFVASIFDQFGKIHGKALVGNKTPGLVRRLRDFHTAWPKARFVHLIRDGRDVYLSTLHRHLKRPKAGVFDTWAEDPAATAALWWELNVRSGRQAGNPLGPELYYEIRYESLVAKPEEECKALCEFLAVRYDDAMLRFHEGQTRRRAARPITPGLRDWRSQMAAEDAERFEAAAGDLLDELGYTRACKWPSPDAAQQAARIRAAFEQRCAPSDDCRSLGRAKAATLLGSEGT
jgi:hypothetical protein